jgi:hypothetical protein
MPDVTGRMKAARSEGQLACELVRVLDGLSIKDAREVRALADMLLLTTQVVHADSACLAVVTETDRALDR